MKLVKYIFLLLIISNFNSNTFNVDQNKVKYGIGILTSFLMMKSGIDDLIYKKIEQYYFAGKYLGVDELSQKLIESSSLKMSMIDKQLNETGEELKKIKKNYDKSYFYLIKILGGLSLLKYSYDRF